jgi:hypothetical protein
MEKWLRSAGFACNGDTKPNFVSLTGGKFFVPASSRGIVAVVLAREIAAGKTSALCECPTPTMRAYVDIDAAPIESADRWARAVLDAALQLWDVSADQLACTIATKTDHSPGIHVHVHDVIADADTLKQFATSIADRMASSMASEDGKVDAGVYRSGLRMVGCAKRGARAVYIPTHTFDGTDMAPVPPPDSQDAWLQAIRACSIASDEPPTPLRPGATRPASDTCSSCAAAFERACISERLLRDAFAHLPEPLRTAPISSIVRHDTTIVVGLKSRVCLNLTENKREHRSNHVYLVITPEGIHQKCHSKSDNLEGRVDGPCKHFRSAAFPIPAAPKAALFPQLAPPTPTDTTRRVPTARRAANVAHKFARTL